MPSSLDLIKLKFAFIFKLFCNESRNQKSAMGQELRKYRPTVSQQWGQDTTSNTTSICRCLKINRFSRLGHKCPIFAHICIIWISGNLDEPRAVTRFEPESWLHGGESHPLRQFCKPLFIITLQALSWGWDSIGIIKL